MSEGHNRRHELLCLVQIQTSKQHAISIVHLYPLLPDKIRLLEALARQHKEPSTETLMQLGDVDDLQHAANWQTVETYFKGFHSSMHHHHPLLADNSDHSS